MNEVSQMKDLLLEILTDAYQVPDIQATQNMGVSMTNSMKREGVTIIQNQSVEVLARIMSPLVRAIKPCDVLSLKQETVVLPSLPPPAPEPLQIEAPTKEPVEAFCEWLYDRRTKWKEMQNITKEAYKAYVISRHKTKADAAKWLGIQVTYLSKISKGKEKDDEPK